MPLPDVEAFDDDHYDANSFNPNMRIQDFSDYTIESRLLKDALGRIKPKQAQAVWLHYVHGYTQFETGHIMGCSQMQVGRLIKKGIRALREILARETYCGESTT